MNLSNDSLPWLSHELAFTYEFKWRTVEIHSKKDCEIMFIWSHKLRNYLSSEECWVIVYLVTRSSRGCVYSEMNIEQLCIYWDLCLTFVWIECEQNQIQAGELGPSLDVVYTQSFCCWILTWFGGPLAHKRLVKSMKTGPGYGLGSRPLWSLDPDIICRTGWTLKEACN